MVGSAKFRKQMERVSKLGWKKLQATNALNDAITKLREICPHLVISWMDIGGEPWMENSGPHHRVCEHCGITETAAYNASDFTTLTHPLETPESKDKSLERRKGATPVLRGRSVMEFNSFIQSPKVDVTEV
jgi:hypothetical protein